MGTEQWVHVVQGDPGPREAFLGRAKDRMVSSAQAQVRRWIDGDLEGADEEALKEHLPELYSQVVAARENEDATTTITRTATTTITIRRNCFFRPI